MTLEEEIKKAKGEIQKAAKIIAELTTTNKRLKLGLVAASIVICVSISFVIFQGQKHSSDMAKQVKLKEEAQLFFDELMISHEMTLDTLELTIDQRDQARDQRDKYIVMYEDAVEKLYEKDDKIETQQKKIYALKWESKEKTKQMEMIAAKYLRKMKDSEDRFKALLGYQKSDSSYQVKIYPDGRKVERVVFTGDRDSTLKASHRGRYLSFSPAKSSTKYLISIYPMLKNDGRVVSKRQSSTINGKLVINLQGLLAENDVTPPYIIEVTHGNKIEWQYRTIKDLPEGALSSHIEPTERRHIYSTGGSRGEEDEKI